MSIAQLGFELGMAVSEYNNRRTDTYDSIIKFTLLYIEEVKRGLNNNTISEDELVDYYIVIGQAWASISSRGVASLQNDMQNEK
jgi:hypothetical protein